MNRRKPATEALRRTALAVLRQGLATPGELRQFLGGLHASNINRWAEAENLDWRPERKRLLEMAWRNAAARVASEEGGVGG